ncbi:hypothetical protein [Actinomadura madurae]|uniref:hypothetical protein n=1 Tax=Actinomadura madurae TaxID=1993 RepID=UPI0020D22049|nr:hypothetical protein [Actinomadura madurae]MCP9947100.1 hypothetical protein [Actinomadura madurae]MCP9963861.1 hypothetical protein [Actinomadura madurae]MCP9976338.1 hypothetical protein [Actinomadura madurae]
MIRNLREAPCPSSFLAFLGGGSLASGGGGMALGATVLNVVTIGPAFLVGGLVVKGQGAKEITKAREREADIAVAIAELDETEARLEGIDAGPMNSVACSRNYRCRRLQRSTCWSPNPSISGRTRPASSGR